MTNQSPCLCLIDGSGYIFRAFYALPPMHRSDGTPTNAVYGFTSMMLGLLHENTCPYIVVVFDAKRQNFRNEIFADYKANRKETPAELIPQFSLIRSACEALNVPWIEKEGFEADDLIATYTEIAKQKGMKARVISADKDLMQLMNDNTFLYDPMKKKEITQEDVIKKFGVNSDKVVEVQALMGDSTDNIPGATGIGPKTAAQLINQFGSIENLYQNIEQIKQEKQRLNLKQSQDNVFVSKKLASLNRNVPVDDNLEMFIKQKLDIQKITQFLTENNFPSLLKRIPSSEEKETLPPLNIQKLTTLEQVRKAVQQILKSPQFSFSINHKENQISEINLSNGTELYQIQSNNQPADLFTPVVNDIPEAFFKELQKLFESKQLKIGWDIKDALHILKNKGIEIKAPYQDILLMGYLLEGNKPSNTLQELTAKYLNTRNFDTNQIGNYLNQLSLILEKELEKEKLLPLYQKMDLPLIDLLFQMEENGIAINRNKILELENNFQNKINLLTKQIHEIAQEEFNINSPQQLGVILFEKRKLIGGKKGPSGHWITDVKVLENLAEEQNDELANLVLKYRALAKLKSTYIDDLIERSQKSPRIHTTFSMVATNTGRLASSNPNLQNIPIKSEEGKEIRETFIAESKKVLLSADYSQIELRLIAHVAKVKKLQDSFIKGEDIHAHTASQILNIPLEQITPDQRRSAKAVNFGIIYGISGFGLARNLHIDRTTANKYIQAYFEQYPEIKEYMERTEKFADENGYVLTPFGRKIYIEGLGNPATRQFAHRAAINAPIQGGAADIMKLAMNKVNQALKTSGLHALPLLQVHDELIFEVPENEAESLAKLVKEQMENVVQLSVPLIAETGVAQNWKEAH